MKMEALPRAVVLGRINALILGMLTVLLCSCMQEQNADPGSSFHKGLQRDAWRTLAAYDTALLAHREKARTEIPPAYWEPGILQLRPLKVYKHRGNLVVAQSVTGGVEQGKYIELPVAPFHPKSAWFSHKYMVDGYVFRPAKGAGVFHYTRPTYPQGVN